MDAEQYTFGTANCPSPIKKDVSDNMLKNGGSEGRLFFYNAYALVCSLYFDTAEHVSGVPLPM